MQPMHLTSLSTCRPWNKGKLTGQKPPLQPKYVWAIRTRLQLAEAKRNLALFNLAIDSKLRGCDLVSLKVDDIAPHGYSIERVTIRQKKTSRPVRPPDLSLSRLDVCLVPMADVRAKPDA